MITAEQIRVGFIGCGTHATEVLLLAVQQAGMDLAAICDLDKRRAQRAVRRFGAFRAYQNLEMMIAEMDLDAVLVCGPPELHAEAAQVALERGLHVWTEAPPAPTADEAERLAELADAKGLIAQVGLMLRFAPAYRRLREVIAAEDFGAPIAFEIAYWSPPQSGHDDPLRHDAVHALDLVALLLGGARELSAPVVAASGPAGGGPRQFAVALRTETGAGGTLSFMAATGCPRELVTVASAGAVATVEDRTTLSVRRADCDQTILWRAQPLGPGPEAGSAYLRGYLPELAHFAATVRGAAEPAATMKEGAAALSLAERIDSAIPEV